MINSEAPAKRGHIVAATLCPTRLPVRGKAWQHCCARCGIFGVQDTKFVFATNVARVAKRVNIWQTWSRQQCCRHIVSSFWRSIRCYETIAKGIGRLATVRARPREYDPPLRNPNTFHFNLTFLFVCVSLSSSRYHSQHRSPGNVTIGRHFPSQLTTVSN